MTVELIQAESDAAWRDYAAAIEDARKQILGEKFIRDHPLERARGLYYLQSAIHQAFAFYIAPRQAYPVLYSQAVYMPFEVTWGLACPDFMYYWAFLDGARTYRIWGTTGTTRWLNVQLQRGWRGDDVEHSLLGNHDLKRFESGDDGSFEFILSPEPATADSIKLDPRIPNYTLLFREIFYDWEHERGVEMFIETLDRTRAESVLYGEEELSRRVRCAARMIRFQAQFAHDYTTRLLANAHGANRFFLPPPNASANEGGSPHATYIQMVYDIQPGEALIIEVEIPPGCPYWSFQLGDLWYQTLDYTYHQSSLNGHQAAADSDGKVRCVVAMADPGVPNWIDASELSYGTALWRYYLTARTPVPSVQKVPLSSVREHVPPDTPVVSAALRKASLHRRARASLRRYGFAPGKHMPP